MPYQPTHRIHACEPTHARAFKHHCALQKKTTLILLTCGEKPLHKDPLLSHTQFGCSPMVGFGLEHSFPPQLSCTAA